MIAGLPYDAEVEYLESTKSQWILLDIDNINTELACDVVCRSLDIGLNDNWAFGDYSNNNSYNFLFGQYSSRFCITLGGDGGGFFYCGQRDGNDHRIRINRDGGIWFDDQLEHEGNVYQYHQSITHNIRLFGGHNTHSPNTPGYNLPSRIYSRKCKFWYGNTLVRDMIAVRFTNEQNQSEGAMYDRVSRKLFRNAGTGSFTIGPDVATPVMGLHFFKSQIKTAKDYVQNGLIAMWDGIENAGWGVHEAAATTWKDLIGERDATVASAGSWKDNALHCDGTTYGARFAQSYDGFRTLEACYKFGGGTNGGVGFVCVVSSGNGNGVLINKDEGSFGFGYYANSPYFLGGPTVGASATVVGVWDADPASNKNTSQYVNGAVVTTTVGYNTGFGSGRAIVFGACQDGGRPVVADIYCLRLYDRALTAAEIAANYAIDKVRFNLP